MALSMRDIFFASVNWLIQTNNSYGITYGEICIWLYVFLMPAMFFLFTIVNIVQMKRYRLLTGILLLLNVIAGILLFIDIQ